MISERVTGGRVIRTALPAEAEAVTDLHARARATYYPDGFPDDGTDWLDAWSSALARPDGQVLCAVEQGRLVAIASFRVPEETGRDTVKLFQFHVDPGHWRSGIGTALHAACVEQWRADSRRTAVLDVHAGNDRARAFYARQGWLAEPSDGGHHLRLRLDVSGGSRRRAE
ncbi:GNAT family N-acetyltransferase [Streptomyces sp. NPDC005423]|uniref:GNAT family N-acetyltransferase n=1 Tax=Streptomyces sp. NPDC005423 TaxID=3155343 RepID=UPI0033A8FE67